MVLKRLMQLPQHHPVYSRGLKALRLISFHSFCTKFDQETFRVTRDRATATWVFSWLSLSQGKLPYAYPIRL